MAQAPPPPATSEPSSSAAAPRGFLSLCFSRRRPTGVEALAVWSGEPGRKNCRAPDSSAGARAHGDRLVEAVRVVGRDVNVGVSGADILELSMAKGPMFSWLSYRPEEGYPKEDHHY